MTLPEPHTVTLPTIEYKPAKSAWGKNFTRLDTEPVWYHMTEETRKNILSKNTVRIALKHFAKEMTAREFELDKLFAMNVSTKGRTWIKTRKPLSERVQKMYKDPRNNGRGSHYFFELLPIIPATNTPIPREQGSSYQYWKNETGPCGGHRNLARQLAKEHNVHEFWMMYGISVALRIVESLLCQGYVIVVVGQGRFWIRNVPEDFINIKEGHRVVFQAEQDFGWPYKKPTK